MLIARRDALSESFEPSSGRDYGGVSVIHLQPRPTATVSFHIKEDGGRGEERRGTGEVAFQGLFFNLSANVAYTVLSDLILHHTSQTIGRGSCKRFLDVPLIAAEQSPSAARLLNDLGSWFLLLLPPR